MPHFIIQLAPSGHDALAGWSQHAQFFVFVGAAIFSQSLMAPAGSFACADAPLCAGMDALAQAVAIGVNVSDTAIRIARIKRKRDREEVPFLASIACTSLLEPQCVGKDAPQRGPRL
jgi:hypothetical protein